MEKRTYKSPAVLRSVLLGPSSVALLAGSDQLSPGAGMHSGGHEVGENKDFTNTTFNHEWN